MRCVIQRVRESSVSVDGQVVGAIGQGLMVLVGIVMEDTQEDIDWLCRKIAGLRIFDDEKGVMNLSIKEIGGEILAISQFTLMAMTKKGNRPSYINAARPEFSEPMYMNFCKTMEKETGLKVKRGIFGADMKVRLLNDGPVTIVIDTKNKE